MTPPNAEFSTGGKVFGIGLSKTGTTSLYAALHVLGYRSGTFGHMRALGLTDWFRGDFSVDYLEAFDAVTDLPIGCFFPQLDERYPNSRFILTVREIETWLSSCQKQFTREPDLAPGFTRDVHMAAYGISTFDDSRFRFVHETHRRNAEWYFQNRPSDLLILDIIGGEGWPKLCDFLGHPVPDVPFPNVKPGYRVEENV